MSLDREWGEVLDRYELPYFRMSSCAHGNYPFNKLSRDVRIEVETSVIELINKYAAFGVAVAVNEADYRRWFPRGNHIGSPYAYCCWQVMAGIFNWMNKRNFEGHTSYFFEAGHASQSEANALMMRIFNDPRLRQQYRYANHRFVDKEKVRPVQTADILAWQYATQVKRWIKGDNRMRADCRALMAKPQHEVFIATRKTLAETIAYANWEKGTLEPGISGFFGDQWFYCQF